MCSSYCVKAHEGKVGLRSPIDVLLESDTNNTKVCIQLLQCKIRIMKQMTVFMKSLCLSAMRNLLNFDGSFLLLSPDHHETFPPFHV